MLGSLQSHLHDIRQVSSWVLITVGPCSSPQYFQYVHCRSKSPLVDQYVRPTVSQLFRLSEANFLTDSTKQKHYQKFQKNILLTCSGGSNNLERKSCKLSTRWVPSAGVPRRLHHCSRTDSITSPSLSSPCDVPRVNRTLHGIIQSYKK